MALGAYKGIASEELDALANLATDSLPVKRVILYIQSVGWYGSRIVGRRLVMGIAGATISPDGLVMLV